MTLICFCFAVFSNYLTCAKYILSTGLSGSILETFCEFGLRLLFPLSAWRNHDALSHEHDIKRNKKNISSEFTFICPKVLLLTMTAKGLGQIGTSLITFATFIRSWSPKPLSRDGKIRARFGGYQNSVLLRSKK